jgi:hypothetical protein
VIAAFLLFGPPQREGCNVKLSSTARSYVVDPEAFQDSLPLDRECLRRVAMRILLNKRILTDLYDHFLIQRSLGEPEQSIAWESYAGAEGSRRSRSFFRTSHSVSRIS